MNESTNDQKLQRLFRMFSQDFKDYRDYSSSYQKKLQKVKALIDSSIRDRKQFLNANSRPGHFSINQTEKVGLQQLVNSREQFRSKIQKDKVFITRMYFGQPPTPNASQPQNLQSEISQGLTKRAQLEQQHVLLAYFRNNFYLLKDVSGKTQFSLQKTYLYSCQILDLKDHCSILIQPVRRFESLIKDKDQISSDFRGLVNQQYDDYNNKMPGKLQELAQFHYMFKSELHNLCSPWLQPSQYRVAIILQQQNVLSSRSRDRIKSNLFIYHKFQVFSCHKSQNQFRVNIEGLQPFVQSQLYEIRLLKQLLLNSIIYSRHKNAVKNILSFKQKLQLTIYQCVSQKVQNKRSKQRSIIQKVKINKYFTSYQNQHIKKLFADWMKQVKRKESSKIPILCIALNDLYLTDQYKYTKMRCEVSVSYQDKAKLVDSQPQVRNYTYEFDQANDDWSVRLTLQPDQRQKVSSLKGNSIISQNRTTQENLCFDLSKVPDKFSVRVQLTPLQSGSSISVQRIGGLYVTYKSQQMRAPGQRYSLVLYSSRNSILGVGQQCTVGFLNLFFLVKSHHDMGQMRQLKIQNYHKLNVLENIGIIPQNYYQPLRISYSPDLIPLFSQLVSEGRYKINKKIFQQVYIKLTEFLQFQTVSNRRDRQMAVQLTNNRNHSSFIRGNPSSFIRGNNSNRAMSLKDNQEHSYNMSFFPQQRLQKYSQILFLMAKRQRLQITKSKPQDRYLINSFVYFSINPSNPSNLAQKSTYRYFQDCQDLLCYKNHRQTSAIVQAIFQQCQEQQRVKQYIVSVYKVPRNNVGNLSSHVQKDSKSQHVMMDFEIRKCVDEIGTQPKHAKSVQAFNPYLVPLINRIVTIYKLDRMGQCLDNHSLRSSVKQRQSAPTEEQFCKSDFPKATQFTFNFLYQLYPYFKTQNLQKQLMYVRYFVQKYLPQFNFTLNRRHIGLENLVSKYLLSLFSCQLEEQITFQIWDFLVLSQNKFAARMSCILTLLIFLQKTDLHPIIPLNSFTKALHQNSNKFDFSRDAKRVADLMTQNLGKIYEKQSHRKNNLRELKDDKGNLLLGHQFVKKIMFDTCRAQKVSFEGNKKINLNDLSYRLPQPKYYGYPVEQVKLLLRGFCIFDTVAMNQWNLTVHWHNMSSQKIPINQKSQILNHYLKFQYPKHSKANSYDLPCIKFIMYPEQNHPKKCLIGYLPILNLHKDHVYCEQVRLFYIRDGEIQLTNKGQNIISVQIILKSHQSKITGYSNNTSKQNNFFQSQVISSSKVSSLQATTNNLNLRFQKQYYINQQKRVEKLYDLLLDYSLAQSQNEGIKQIHKLKASFHSMKNPIDQFKCQKYQKLKVPTVGENTFPQIVMNSQLLIQHFQALIYESFPKSQPHKTKVPDLYKIFSKHTNYQMVFLTQILIEAILLDKGISFNQKMQYLYCLGKHYQNCGGTGLTMQTVDYLFSYVYKAYGWLNAVPYSFYGKGEILSGVIYTKGVKVKQDVLDITDILRDWAHICKVKYGHLGLVLGNAQYLTQLRSLLPLQTLEMLQNKNGRDDVIRVQIIYSRNSSQYIWSSTVYLQSFKIKYVGTKFLERQTSQNDLHPGNINIHNQKCLNMGNIFIDAPQKCQRNCPFYKLQLDTSSQIMYNCSNFISLQSSKTMDRLNFKKSIYNTPLLCYLLNYSSLNQRVQIKDEKFSLQQQKGQSSQAMFGTNTACKDWVLYRYQNCIQKWRPCSLQRINENHVGQVKFGVEAMSQESQLLSVYSQYLQFRKTQLIYKAPDFEIWSMAQNLLDLESTKKSGNFFSEMFKRNQKQAMTKIANKPKEASIR